MVRSPRGDDREFARVAGSARGAGGAIDPAIAGAQVAAFQPLPSRRRTRCEFAAAVQCEVRRFATVSFGRAGCAIVHPVQYSNNRGVGCSGGRVSVTIGRMKRGRWYAVNAIELESGRAVVELVDSENMTLAHRKPFRSGKFHALRDRGKEGTFTLPSNTGVALYSSGLRRADGGVARIPGGASAIRNSPFDRRCRPRNGRGRGSPAMAGGGGPADAGSRRDRIPMWPARHAGV